MAKKSHSREPDDEPDADPAVENDELEQDAADAPEVIAQASQAQSTAHVQAVTIAKGTLQGTIAGAVAAKNAGGTAAALTSAVKAADIAYYQSVIASAQANNMPIGGAIDALKQLGAF